MSIVTLTAADIIRLTDFTSYIGQTKMKERLTTHIASARKRGVALGHTLLLGPPGAGKTTMAAIIAAGMGLPLYTFEMPFSDADYRNLRNIGAEPCVIFLDEIHRPTKGQQEELLSLLEHNYLRPKGKFRMEFGEHTTIIGATTDASKVIKPLSDRFMIQPHFDPYTDDEMGEIAMGMAGRMGVELSPEGCLQLGKAAADVPRKVSHLITAARDIVVQFDEPTNATEVLAFTRTTPDGLIPDHVAYLNIMLRMDAAVGLSSLKQMLETDEGTISDRAFAHSTGIARRGSKGQGVNNRRLSPGEAFQDAIL